MTQFLLLIIFLDSINPLAIRAIMLRPAPIRIRIKKEVPGPQQIPQHNPGTPICVHLHIKTRRKN